MFGPSSRLILELRRIMHNVLRRFKVQYVVINNQSSCSKSQNCNALSVLWWQKEVVDSPDIPVQSFALKDLLTDPGVLHTAAFGLFLSVLLLIV